MTFLRMAMPRRVRIEIRKKTSRLRDKLGPFFEAVLVVTAASLILLVGTLIVDASLGDLLWGGLAALTAGITTYWTARIARRHAVLIEVTLSYLVSGGFGLLDKFLGRLISGRWRSEQIRPGDALFDALREIIRGHNYWRKRRIAEALPMLGTIDKDRTLELLRALRDDWDPKWESDNRRRAVEALSVMGVGQREALLDTFNTHQIEEILRPRQGDQVWVVMATVEVLSSWRETESDRAAALLVAVEGFALKQLPEIEAEAVLKLSQLLDSARTRRTHEVQQLLAQMILSASVFERVAAARNFDLISKDYPQDRLVLMDTVLQMTGEEDRNVRRAIAREKSVEFLIRMLGSRLYRDRSLDLLKRMVLQDPEDIIRVAAFDKLEMLAESEPELMEEICRAVMKREQQLDDLRERAERVLEDVIASRRAADDDAP